MKKWNMCVFFAAFSTIKENIILTITPLWCLFTMQIESVEVKHDTDEIRSRGNHQILTDCTWRGEKPYKCDFCGRGFAHRYNMKVHRRIHTGEKPYKCDLCLLQFDRLSRLTEHKKIHLGPEYVLMPEFKSQLM